MTGERCFVMQDKFDYAASISFMDVRESLPSIDPENLSSQDVLDILLHLFRQKQGFVDLGHEVNNRETGWVNGYLFRRSQKGLRRLEKPIQRRQDAALREQHQQ